MTHPVGRPVEYAGFWNRFGAFVVDSVAFSIVLAPLGYVLFERRDTMAELLAAQSVEDPTMRLLMLASLLGPASVGEFLLNYGLPAVAVVLFWMYKSATPGKMATRAVIADAKTLGPLTQRQCVVRYLGYFVSIFTLGLGFLWIAWDRRKQGFHDKLAGTVVVLKPKS